MKALYQIRWGRMWLWALAVFLLGIGGGWLLWSSAAPETDLDAPAVRMTPLIAVSTMPWGLVRVQVDGRTFLLYSDRHGVDLVEEIKCFVAELQEGGDGCQDLEKSPL